MRSRELGQGGSDLLLSCNAVKNVVLTGFGDITLLDLDTIDLSNLNRQFLFRKKDIKQSKAFVRPFVTSLGVHPPTSHAS